MRTIAFAVTYAFSWLNGKYQDPGIVAFGLVDMMCV
jgi:hypothetical protein